MQSENRIFDDIAKVVNGFAGTVTGMGREAEAAMRERMKEFVSCMDFVSFFLSTTICTWVIMHVRRMAPALSRWCISLPARLC